MRILLIEDDAAMSESIELMLRSDGMTVYTTTLGEEGLDLSKVYEYDAVVLDIGLPDMSGFDVVRAMRRSGVKTPVLALSGHADVDSKVKGLTNGADDYLAKPFHKNELCARLYAIVRRSRGLSQSTISYEGMTVNLDSKLVHIDGAQVGLTNSEYKILELLALRKGFTLTKEMLLNHLYGGMDEPDAKIIDVFMCKLRKKLANASGGRSFIETVWGRGYTLRSAQEASKAA